MTTLNKTTAIATRTLIIAGTSNPIDILIGTPTKITNEEWACAYRIVGTGIDICHQVHGMDSFQAMQCVFKVIDSVLISLDLDFCWGDGSVYVLGLND